jgi:hypothetical protein
MRRRVVRYKLIDISEQRTASIFRVEDMLSNEEKTISKLSVRM